jgi:hypothetical protein
VYSSEISSTFQFYYSFLLDLALASASFYYLTNALMVSSSIFLESPKPPLTYNFIKTILKILNIILVLHHHLLQFYISIDQPNSFPLIFLAISTFKEANHFMK